METKIKTNNLSRNILTIGQIDLQMNFENATLPDAENYHCKKQPQKQQLGRKQSKQEEGCF